MPFRCEYVGGINVMSKIGMAAAALAAGLLVAQPCAAQGVNGMQFERPPSAFAGIGLRWSFDSATEPRPSVRLQFTADPGSRAGTVPSADFRPRGLEIGVRDTGKPALFVNGRSAAAARNQLGLGGGSGGQTALIVGGVLIAVVVIALAAGGAGPGDTCPTIGGSRDHCVNP